VDLIADPDVTFFKATYPKYVTPTTRH